MEFSKNELIFLNSITEGSQLVGVPLVFREKDRKKAVADTLQGLIKKGVLQSETELSKLGLLPARAVEEYKQSNRHVIIGRCHIAFGQRGDLVVILATARDQYEIFRTPKEALLLELIKNFPALQRETPQKFSRQFKRMDMNQILKAMKEYDGNMTVGDFKKGEAVSEQFLFWNAEQIYSYDIKSEMRRTISPRDVRMMLMNLLEIPIAA